jgi:hypothetical protein
VPARGADFRSEPPLETVPVERIDQALERVLDPAATRRASSEESRRERPSKPLPAAARGGTA